MESEKTNVIMADKVLPERNLTPIDTTENMEVSPKHQRTFFYTSFLVLVGIVILNLILSILLSVFNFYNFDYSNFYSVIVYYLFLLTCGLFMPTRMPGEQLGIEQMTSQFRNLPQAVPMNDSSIPSSISSSNTMVIPAAEVLPSKQFSSVTSA